MSSDLLEFLTSGNVFGLVIAVLVCEVLLLGLFRRWWGHGIAFLDLLASLGAGLGLSVAALLIAKGAPAIAVGAALCLALLAHSIDLRRRWRH